MAESRLDVVIRGEDDLSPELSKIESRIIRFVGAVSAAIAGIKVVSFPITAAADFEREMANVAKTTNFSKQKIDDLGASLLDMSLRVDIAASDLAKIAAAAGQQGLGRTGVAGIASFTDSVSRMASVLDITADEAGTNIGKIINIFKTPMSELERVVSAFNQVSNNSTASGKDLLDVVKRIGDAAGTLRLDQVVGLAATGLDMGQSPEVVGSAFSTMFAKLFQNAKQLGQLMGMSANEWIATLQKDGITGFKLYLSKLRELDAQSQINTITKLTGGGRQGSLLLKLVRDVNNEVLDRNLKQNEVGYTQAISALREQATVLGTFKAQFQILQNSVFKIAADGGKQLTEPLKNYAAQLSEALQSAGVRSFVSALVGAFGDLLSVLVRTVQFIGSLNVNWENFLNVAKAFIGLKVAESFSAMLARMSGLSGALQSISSGSNAATRGINNVSNAANGLKAGLDSSAQGAKSWSLATALGYDQALAKLQAYNAGLAETKALQSQMQRRQGAAASSLDAEAGVAQVASAGLQGLRRQGNDVAAASAAFRAAQQNVASQVAADQARQQASQQQAAQRHAAVMQQIDQVYQAEKLRLTQNGSRADLAALKEELANQQAQADAQYARSLRGIETYWSRRIALTRTNAEAEVAVQAAALARANTQMDTQLADQAARNTALLSARQRTNSANALVQDTAAALGTAVNPTVTLFSRLQNAGTVAMTRIALGVEVLRTALTGLATIATKAFFWVTIIYSIADALGLVEKLGGLFKSLADAIGLTSKAQRDKAIADEQEKQAMQDKLKRLNELIEAYQKYKDVSTGSVRTSAVSEITDRIGNADTTAERKQAVQDLVSIVEGANAEIDKLGVKADESVNKSLASQQKRLADAQAQIAKLQQSIANPAGIYTPEGILVGQESTARYEDALVKAKKAADEAQASIAQLTAAAGNTGTVMGQAGKSVDEVAKGLATVFSSQSADAFQKMVVPIGEASAKLDEMRIAQENATQALQKFKEDDNSRDYVEAKQRVEDTSAAYVAQNTVVENLRAALRTMIVQMTSVPGLDPNVVKSLQDLNFYANLSANQIVALSGALLRVPQIGVNFNAQNAGIASAGASTGSRAFDPKANSESEARKEARARLQLERAQIQAEDALKKERNDQLLQRDTDLYDRGLQAIKTYYAERKRLLLEANSFEIADKQRELDAINKEASQADKNSERLKFQAEAAKVQGQINVLRAKRKGIDDDNAEAQRKADEAFNDRVLSETNTLVRDSILPSDTGTAFKGMLDEQLASYRTFLNQLRSEGKVDLANAIELGFKFKVFDQSIQPVKTQIDLIYDSVDRLTQKLTLMGNAGALTSNEIKAAFDNMASAQIPKLQALVAQQEKQLAAMEATKDQAPVAYGQLAASVDAARLKMMQLQDQMNQTAKEFNKTLTDSLATALDNLEPTFASLRQTALQLLLDIANQMKKVFAQDLAEQIIRGLGSSGSGGLGGFIQSIVQGNSATQGKAAGALSSIFGGSAGAVALGSTPATPMYVSDVANTVGSALGGGDDPLGQFIDGLGLNEGGGSGGFFGDLKSQLSGITDGLMDTLSNAFSGLGDMLGSLFSSMFGGGSSSGFFSAIMAAFAHTGGVAGSVGLQRRAVNPAVFANAIRYHTGGIAGLQPNEVPAVLQKGEEVLTANDPRHRNNGGADSGMNIRNILVTDPNFVPDSMNTVQGEKTILTILSRNKTAVKQLIK